MGLGHQMTLESILQTVVEAIQIYAGITHGQVIIILLNFYVKTITIQFSILPQYIRK